MIFQFFLILTLSSAKVFVSGSNDGPNGSDDVKAKDPDTEEAIKYLVDVDSLYVYVDPFETKLPELSVRVIEIIKKEYTTVLTDIWKLSELNSSDLNLDFNNDQVNNDKKAKAVLTKVDNNWNSDKEKVGAFRTYLIGKINEHHPKEKDLTSAVLYRFAKFLPDDRNEQREDGIFYKLRKNFGGLSGDQLLGDRYSKTDSDPRVNFLNTVIKLSSIKNNPNSGVEEIKDISRLLDKVKEEVKEENNKIKEKEELQGKAAAQNEAVVKAQREAVAAEAAEAQSEAVVEAQREAVAAEEAVTQKEAEVAAAKLKVDVAVTSVLKKLNDVWLKLKGGNTPPCEHLLKEYVALPTLQATCDVLYDMLKENIDPEDTLNTGIFNLLFPIEV